MLFKPKDFPADYVTKELASKVANSLLSSYLEEQGICTHPIEKISATFLSWRMKDCDFECECGQKLEMVKWLPRSKRDTKLVDRGFESDPMQSKVVVD